MLEYPEAVKITKQMQKELIGKKIQRIAMDNYSSLVKQGFIKEAPKVYEKRLVDKTINKITNYGKYFVLELEPDEYMLVFSFETSGKVLYHKNQSTLPKKFTLKLTFTDNSMFTIYIIAWGFVLVESNEYFQNHKYISFKGFAPLDEKLTSEKFKELLLSHTKSIKTFFVGQKYIAGIGNGFLQDIFFKANINPKRKVQNLSEEEIKRLYFSMQEVMKEAIQKGGRDTEVDLYGNTGKYVPILDKRMKDKQCPICGTLIDKQQVDGSTAYICAKCQPL